MTLKGWQQPQQRNLLGRALMPFLIDEHPRGEPAQQRDLTPAPLVPLQPRESQVTHLYNGGVERKGSYG